MFFNTRKTLWCISLLFLSFSSSKHSVWVIVNNTSLDKAPVDIKLSLMDNKEVNTVIAEQQVPPGIQQLPEKKIKEGTYQLWVNANNNEVMVTQPVTLDADRWIMINYIREDSATIIKTNGYLDTSRYKKINGQYVSINIYVDNRRPTGL